VAVANAANAAYFSCMSDTDLAVEKQRPAHWFKPGVSGNPAGRARGSRNRLADAFVTDLHGCWERHGVAALERVATEQPEILVKVIASILPKDISLTVAHAIDPSEFVGKFRKAQELLGNYEPRRLKAIDGD
jgi:hypothetical protein